MGAALPKATRTSLLRVSAPRHGSLLTHHPLPSPSPLSRVLCRPMPQTVLDWLVRRFPAAKRQNLKHMTQAGRVRINGRPAKTLRQILADSDDVTLTDKAPKTPPPARVNADIAAPSPT